MEGAYKRRATLLWKKHIADIVPQPPFSLHVPPPPPPCVGDARLETPSRGVRYLLVLLIACDTVMPLDREIW